VQGGCGADGCRFHRLSRADFARFSTRPNFVRLAAHRDGTPDLAGGTALWSKDDEFQ
jgi:hypothetical protein